MAIKRWKSLFTECEDNPDCDCNNGDELEEDQGFCDQKTKKSDTSVFTYDGHTCEVSDCKSGYKKSPSGRCVQNDSPALKGGKCNPGFILDKKSKTCVKMSKEKFYRNKLKKFFLNEWVKFGLSNNEDAAFLKEFIKNYKVCVLFAETDGEEPLDRNYNVNDFSREANDQIRKDCISFINQVEEDGITLDHINSIGKDAQDLAFNFHYTRNGHGVGFWDTIEWNRLSKDLTSIAKKFNNIDVYVGDNRKIYIM